jgi:transketolase
MFDGFLKDIITKEDSNKVNELGKVCRGDILTMTSLAKSGHPGGSMSSLEIFLTVYGFAKLFPKDPFNDERDRIFVSHGHTSPGVYSVLGRLGFFNIDEAIAGFRKAGSIFEGHITRGIPGVEWTSGNLGQGLSAGVGSALALKIKNKKNRVFVLMGDAEQNKGQVAEARRLAVKYSLDNLVVVIDYNDAQISGKAHDVMQVNIEEDYLADGWNVISTEGHDVRLLYSAIKRAIEASIPTVVIAKTVIGKGVSFMENQYKYHGKPLNEEEYEKAFKELGLENKFNYYKELRSKIEPKKVRATSPKINLQLPKIPKRIVYDASKLVGNRNAFGAALLDIAKNSDVPMMVYDCDLASSVKTDKFWANKADWFIQAGVQEHNVATAAGVSSVEGLATIYSDFGAFGLDEVFNQQRLNDINHANLKTFLTHCGIDVGEDAKTHQEINYINLSRSFYYTKLIVPADGNQTDAITRYVIENEGNFIVVMGRSNLPVITDEDGNIFYDENYKFVYGKADILRKGSKAAIISYGTTVKDALDAHKILSDKGVNVTVINMSTPTEIDMEVLKSLKDYEVVVTVEDHNVNGGIGSILQEKMFENDIRIKKFIKLGLRDYSYSADAKTLYSLEEMNGEAISAKIMENL